MFFDFNVAYSTGGTRHGDLKSRIETYINYGYDVVAVNHTVPGKLTAKDTNSIPKIESADITDVKAQGVLKSTNRKTLKQLSRLTVVVENASINSFLHQNNPIVQSYDILAVQPMNEKALQLCCGSIDCDIISLDFSGKLPFRVKHGPVSLAISKGAYFEITYSAAIQDLQARRNLIANVYSLVKTTKGKNLILSSAASNALEIRGPYDVINLSTIFGMNQADGKASISSNCRAVLLRAETRRNSIKGVISMQKIDTIDPKLTELLEITPQDLQNAAAQNDAGKKRKLEQGEGEEKQEEEGGGGGGGGKKAAQQGEKNPKKMKKEGKKEGEQKGGKAKGKEKEKEM